MNPPQLHFNAAHRSAYLASDQHALVMAPPNRPNFTQPHPLPMISPVMAPIPEYPSFWWDRAGPLYPASHIHSRVNNFLNTNTTECWVRKRK